MEERKWCIRISVAKTEGKRPRGRPWCRWEDNITDVLQK
jgi:hypothetical protein